MPGIEDLVVEEIIRDFQQASPAPGGGVAPNWQDQSSFFQEAQYNALANRGMAPGAVTDPRAPQGFTIADPAQRARYGQFNEQQARAAALGGVLERGMRERDQNRFKIMEGLRGLDPQIQGTILRRLGIDPGPIKSQVEQQKELATHKAELERPQQETANAIRMLLASQQQRQGTEELGLKRESMEQEAASRGQTQNIQLMRVLATLMQTDQRLQQTLGPILLQMLQASGINLGTPQPAAAGAGGRAGIKITRE